MPPAKVVASKAHVPRPSSSKLRFVCKSPIGSNNPLAADDTRYQKMRAWLEEESRRKNFAAMDVVEDVDNTLDNVATSGKHYDCRWHGHFRKSLLALLDEVEFMGEGSEVERLLRHTWKWFQEFRSRRGKDMLSGQDVHFVASAKSEPPPPHARPGSAFYDASGTEHGDLGLRHGWQHSEVVPTTATLPSARERLRFYERHQVVKNQPAQRPRSAITITASKKDEYMASMDRPATASTATGGGLTARSLTSSRATTSMEISRPSSARSRGSPRPWAGAAGLAGRRSPHRFMEQAQAAAMVDTNRFPIAPPQREPLVASYAEVEAQVNMEERWFEKRQHDVQELIAHEDRRAAVARWAEQRARCEEESLRNIETIRWQSDLPRRAYIQPTDSGNDVDTAKDGVTEVHMEPATSTTAAAAVDGRARDTPRSNAARAVSTPASQSGDAATNVRFEPPAPSSARLASNDTPSRADYLRMIHGRLLEAAPDPEVDDLRPPTQGETPGFVSLSPYNNKTAEEARQADDIELLVNACEWWKQKHPAVPRGSAGDSGFTFEAMRSKQQQEVEAVKQAMANHSQAFNENTMARALVMPQHQFNANVGLFNDCPALPKNPLYEPPKARKKKKKGGAKSKSKAK
mmetsp:Transcript_3596/g.9049  ORF Transcript_3596/g.9049 Transcript_3596/m.9049 type:complete len:633 (-) Transcript_3596:89-1987(-)